MVAYVKGDGAVGEVAPRREATLDELGVRYLEAHAAVLEPETLRGIRRHFGHLRREMGGGFPIRTLTLDELQKYVNRRLRAKTKRGVLAPATALKEVVTLRAAWNWWARLGVLEGRCPCVGLRYPKARRSRRT
ncbi:hypothetical protein [Paludisphaera mucosa]|uniref:Core-binding (CB) domain-containing protein n=1 Tax=Paludisphaera mucosa TaxID=3030827 RepID=A0ABT6F4B8_9BACT|nr:hypothetical protein [Paludisphaera mucosa]MDG3002430.1 hypothetical protein [Paludisphaera mucosa]